MEITQVCLCRYFDSGEYMNAVEKNKLKIILVITSILTLVFIAIYGKEYLDERRRDKALKYYNKISVTVNFADTL